MKLQIISKETIKPSSPTPGHVRTHKFSLLDQMAPCLHIPYILFYSATGQTSRKTSHLLKKTFAETLTQFYPFAGKAHANSFTIDCNDSGAKYIEAYADVEMAVVIQQADVEQLQRLLPYKPREFSLQDILAVQVNYFSCGGMAIGICLNHKVADGYSLTYFLEMWAGAARGANAIKSAIFDCASIFPPVNPFNFSWDDSFPADYLTNKRIVRKRFVFEGSKLSALRSKIGSRPSLDNLTRYEAVSALIWGAFIATTRRTDATVEDHLAVSVVELRKRMNRSLPLGQYMGNMCFYAVAHGSAEIVAGYNELAGKIRKSIKESDESHTANGFLNLIKNAAEKFGNRSNLRIFLLSWVKFPNYEVNFGWGGPTWLGTGNTPETGAFFAQTSDGKGLEAWLGLPKEDMILFEKHPDILEYASFKPSSRL